MNYLTNHSYLNIENVKLLKENDKVRWIFYTDLNGAKDETVTFHGVVDKENHSNWDDNGKTETRIVKAIDATYDVADWGRVQWAQTRENNFYFYIWTNGYNPLKVISVNDKPWEEILKENGFNTKSETQQQYEHDMIYVNKLIENSTPLEVKHKSDYEKVYLLKDTSVLKGELTNQDLYVSITTAFGNVANEEAYLTTNKKHEISAEPFQIGLSTISIYVEKAKHDGDMYIFLIPNQDIEGKKASLEKYVKENCKLKETSFGPSYIIKNA